VPLPPPKLSYIMSDTITAIATGLVPCGIGVIRVSGDDAFSVAEAIFTARSGAPVSDFNSHTVHYGSLIDLVDGEKIDDVLLTVFRAPGSYTGEDVVEISCHGGLATMRKALEATLRAGARLAEPGEFTKRAFLNGRLDLAQAEAVNDLIRAGTDGAQRIARMQLDGGLSCRVEELEDGLMSVLARIEASIDFPDDVEEPEREAVSESLRETADGIAELIQTFSRGRIYREGIRMVIAGRPNVGKSSLLNALLREARAIVTPVPGTTRDTIEETLSIRGIPIVAIDTAGLRESADAVEQIGVERAEQSLAAADLIHFVFDASEGLTEEDSNLLARMPERPVIVAANKIDLLPVSERKIPAIAAARGAPLVPVSALTGDGLDDLEAAIESLVGGGGITAESVLVSNARHKEALESAAASLDQAIATLQSRAPFDLASVDLMAARAYLGEITGETASEDLVDRIFSEFCIGK
jgi:tRNA modification GTPase